MYAEIISIGSELLTPDRVDTNSLWLTAQLNRYGIELKRKVLWGDEVQELAKEIRISLERSPLVITTGGLGPTEDDVTREAVALALDSPLEQRPELVTELEQKFASFNRKMSPNNLRQCMVPRGGVALSNPMGTAPGIMIRQGGSQLFVFPGPPREMQPMFTTHAEPGLVELAGPRRVKRRILRVIGLGESVLDERIAPLYKSIENPKVGILFSPLDVEVHVTATAPTEEEADRLNDDLARQFLQALGNHVYAEGESSLAQVVNAKLRERGENLAVADCATAGLIAFRLCEVHQAAFGGGFLALDPLTLLNWLPGSGREAACELTSNQEELAKSMAEGVRQKTSASYGLAVIAGAQEGRMGKYMMALSSAGTSTCLEMMLPGDSEIRRSRAAQGALDLVRRTMLA